MMEPSKVTVHVRNASAQARKCFQSQLILSFGIVHYTEIRETNTRPASASFIAGIKSVAMSSFTTYPEAPAERQAATIRESS